MKNREEINLDKIEKSQKVRFCGKRYEVGYISCGISIPLLNDFNTILKGEKEGLITAAEASELTLSMLLTFCNNQHHLTRKELNRSSTRKVDEFITIIIRLLMSEHMGDEVTSSSSKSSNKKKQA